MTIDDRFKEVLDKKSNFNTISKIDKTGRKVKQHDKLIQKYYKLEEKEEEADDHKKKFYDEDGNFQWEGQSSSGEEASGEEGEGEMEEEESEEELFGEEEDIPYGETVNDDGIGCRIALNKMDWDSVSALDLLALLRSLCSGEQVIKKVEILPSLFGLEQMKKDGLFGPPKEIFEDQEVAKKKLLTKKSLFKKKKVVESSDSDGGIDLGFQGEEFADAYNQAKLRKYELQKMKYYYGIVHCNTKKTAT